MLVTCYSDGSSERVVHVLRKVFNKLYEEIIQIWLIVSVSWMVTKIDTRSLKDSHFCWKKNSKFETGSKQMPLAVNIYVCFFCAQVRGACFSFHLKDIIRREDYIFIYTAFKKK